MSSTFESQCPRKAFDNTLRVDPMSAFRKPILIHGVSPHPTSHDPASQDRAGDTKHVESYDHPLFHRPFKEVERPLARNSRFIEHSSDPATKVVQIQEKVLTDAHQYRDRSSSSSSYNSPEPSMIEPCKVMVEASRDAICVRHRHMVLVPMTDEQP